MKKKKVVKKLSISKETLTNMNGGQDTGMGSENSECGPLFNCGSKGVTCNCAPTGQYGANCPSLPPNCLDNQGY